MRRIAAVTSATGKPRTAADCGLALAQQRHRAGARAAGCRVQCAQLSWLREDCGELALQRVAVIIILVWRSYKTTTKQQTNYKEEKEQTWVASFR